MGVMDKVFGKLGLSDGAEEAEVLAAETPKKEAAPPLKEKPAPQATKASPQTAVPDNVIDLQAIANGALRGNGKVKVVVIEPQSFDDVQQVANCLKEKKPVVINFEHTEKSVANRIIDFLSGTTYALAGGIKAVDHTRNVYLCSPSNVNVVDAQDRSSIPADMSWLRK
ncbi:MAG: cell division protein SepF [Oscillospiraceae bacterium]|nr:cell division protein SepF [Oscillospiraceae bacterium]